MALAEAQAGLQDKAQVSITSPANGATVGQGGVDVAVAFASKNDHGQGAGKVTSIVLLANGQDAGTFPVPDTVFSGSHTFPGVNLAALSGAGGTVTLVARAFLGKNRNASVDSSAVQVTVQVDTTPPVVSALSPAPGTFTNQARPTLSAQVTDTGGSGVDPLSIVLRSGST